MDFFLLIAFLIIFIPTRVFFRDFDQDYLGRDQTQMVNGAFVILVFFRHFGSYITLGTDDLIFQQVDTYIGQMIVTTFLFYSGYGTAVSLQTKEGYLRHFPKRIFRVWLQFAIAVTIYVLISLITNAGYDLTTILLSYTAYTDVGNSNWYIFALLCTYLFTLIGYALFRKKYLPILFVFACCIGYYIVLQSLGQGTWFYNTCFCFPLGLLIGTIRDRAERVVLRNAGSRFFFFSLLLMIFYLSSAYVHSGMMTEPYAGMFWTGIRSCSFVLMIVIFSAKFKIGNPILKFLGSHIFEIYILQRIPMILGVMWIKDTKILFLVCAAATLLLAAVYQKLMQLIFKAPVIRKLVS